MQYSYRLHNSATLIIVQLRKLLISAPSAVALYLIMSLTIG